MAIVLDPTIDNGRRKGKQTPRYSSIPTYFTSAADDAVDLASVAGLNLLPWQEYVLRGALGEKEDGRWSAFQVALIMPRQNGKNALLEARQLAGLYLFGETMQTHTAHQFKTADNAMIALMNRIKGAPELAEMVEGYKGPEQSLKDIPGFRTGNKPGIFIKVKKPFTKEYEQRSIQYFARSRDSGRGFTGDVIYLDEAYAVKEAEMGALLPTLRAKSIVGNPQVWITSSAGMTDSVYLESVRAQGIEGTNNRMAYFEWSTEEAEDRDPADPIEWDREAWYESNPSMGYLVSEEQMTDEANTLTRTEDGIEEFRRELLGIWSTIGGKPVFPATTWAKSALRPGSAVHLDKPCLAIDVKPDRSESSVSITGMFDGKFVIKVLKVGDGTDWVPAYVKQQALSGYAQGRGVIPVLAIANSSTTGLETELKQQRVRVKFISMTDYAVGCAALQDAVLHNQVRHTNQQDFTDSILAVRRKDRGTAGLFTWVPATDADDICPAVSGTLSFIGAQARMGMLKTDDTPANGGSHGFFG